jgi:hypothetical protein
MNPTRDGGKRRKKWENSTKSGNVGMSVDNKEYLKLRDFKTLEVREFICSGLSTTSSIDNE